MADQPAPMLAFNEQNVNVTVAASLKVEQKQFNNPHIDLKGIPLFNGSGEDAYEFIEAIELIGTSRNWPINPKQGSGTNHFGGVAANAAAAP